MSPFFSTSRTIAVRANGGNIWVAHQPSTHAHAPRVLLLHGNPASMDTWRSLIPQLDGAVEWLCADLPGFGGSDNIAPNPGRTDLDTAAECVYAVVQNVCWAEPFYIVGHSHGAAVAFTLAAQHPESVAGVIAIAGLGVPAHTSYRLLALPGVASLLGWLAPFLTFKALLPLLRPLLGIIMKPMFAPAPVPRAMVSEQLEALTRRPTVLREMANVAQENPSQQLRREAKHVVAKVLFIHGENDQLVPVSRARQLDALLAAAKSRHFELIEGAGHMLHLTHTERVSQLIHSWLVPR